MSNAEDGLVVLEKRLKKYQEEFARANVFESSKKEKGPVPWIISEPFEMSKERLEEIVKIGQEVREFLSACWKTSKNGGIRKEFFESLSDEEREGVRRFKGASVFPMLVRPDLVIDEIGKFWIIEIDLVPAHAGVLQHMQEIYGQSPTIAEQWAQCVPEEIVISIPGWKMFVQEQKYFVQRIREKGGNVRFISIEEWDKISDYKGILFKNCCTISLLNKNYPPSIPKNAVLCPPLILDWKGWMALAHQTDILKRLRLSQRIPETYLLPLKPRKDSDKRRQLLDLSKKERRKWILKPVTAWGGIGFKEGKNLNLGDYKRFGTVLHRFLTSKGKMSFFLLLYRNSISFKYKGNFSLETP
jgi:hypothetical protein